MPHEGEQSLLSMGAVFRTLARLHFDNNHNDADCSNICPIKNVFGFLFQDDLQNGKLT